MLLRGIELHKSFFMAQNNLTITQKALVIGFAGALIGEDSHNFDSLLNSFMDDIGISSLDFQKNMETVGSIINLYGINAFTQFKKSSQAEKRLIKRILTDALKNGINSGNQTVIMLYKNALYKFE